MVVRVNEATEGFLGVVAADILKRSKIFNLIFNLRNLKRLTKMDLLNLVLYIFNTLFNNDSKLSKNTRLPKISKGEQLCLEALREFFPDHTFKTVRPDFLKNPQTGYNLELDLYCPELKLAIEYNGRQHYYYTPYIHGSVEEFNKQVYRDKLKNRLCKKHGITLITVSYTVTDIKSYLHSQLQKHSYFTPSSSCIIL